MKNLICFVIAIAVGMMASVSHANITYQVDRTIDGGTITGFIETDGTLGALSAANILDWELTLTSQNLVDGPSETISLVASTLTAIVGSATTATATDLMFDINTAGSNYFIVQGTSGNFWCIETGECSGGGLGEHIGRGIVNFTAESSIPTGNFVFASIAPTPIVYLVDRTIGGGTITGFIKTDGTLGVLATENIIDWELTLTSPNLAGGPSETISFATQAQTSLNGSTTTATATDLMFDMDAVGNNWFLLQGASTNFWCIETGGCSGAGLGEHLGAKNSGFPAESSLPSGNFVFASTVLPITYQVYRTIGGGTVSGFIETDGTIGTLAIANILDWELTLTSPNLLFGNVTSDTISFSTQGASNLTGSVTTASATDLMFDISGASGEGFFLVQGSSFNFWCIETAAGNCTSVGIGEHIGLDTTGAIPAETGQPAGNFVFASVATPTTYQVDRTIGGGTVTGFIETDGTLGALATENIIDWELTLTSPNIVGGPSETISFAASNQTRILGSTTTATATDLMFDINAAGPSFFFLQGASGNYWCIETGGCTPVGLGEHIGALNNGFPAESSLPTGNFVFASTVLPPSCPADLTGDGELNFFDVGDFLVAFAAEDSAADFDQNGEFNFFDVGDFLTAFSAGCP